MFDQAVVSRQELLSEIRDCERTVAAARARQVRLLRELMRRDALPSADQLASSLDVSTRTARELLETALRSPEFSPAMSQLDSGGWTFDRAAATACLIGTGADDVTIAEAAQRDIAGVHRLRSLQRRITRRSEREAHEHRSVQLWPSLDEAMGFIRAELTGYDWQVVATALDDRGDALPRDAQATARQRRADALVALAQDWLSNAPPARRGGGGPVVTVMIDPELASSTNCEAGMTIPGGPRVGPETLDRIACEGSVEVLVDAGSGIPLAVGPTTRVVPPKLRRFVLARDGGCVVAGCDSTYRIEVHHVVPRSAGGTHDPGNLASLCWWHHHVAIHGRGMRLDPDSPPMTRRLLPPAPDP